MPEEVKDTAQQPEQAPQTEAASETTEQESAAEPAPQTEEEDASIKKENRLAAVLTVLLVVLCVFELGMFTYIGLNVYRTVRTNRMIEERNAAIVQARETSGQAKIQYSGPGRRIVDGVLVSDGSGSSGSTGSVRYVLNTDTHVFHTPSCSEVSAISPEDYDTSSDARDAVVAQGYTACTYCNP